MFKHMYGFQVCSPI